MCSIQLAYLHIHTSVLRNLFNVYLSIFGFVIQFFQIVGRVNRYFTTQPELGKNTVATRYAKFFFEDGREPINFVVEADGIAQPVLIFMQGEFQITIHESQRNNIRKALMSIAKTTFEIHFDSAKEGRIFVDEMGQYSKEGRYLVAR